jgi:hypothetical protein
MTSLAFDNAEMIQILKNRGTSIKNEKWDEVRKIEAKVNEMVDQDREKFSTPCTVFMTFANEEGLKRALNFDNLVRTTDKRSIARLSSFLG